MTIPVGYLHEYTQEALTALRKAGKEDIEKQTVEQLARTYKVSEPTLRKLLKILDFKAANSEPSISPIAQAANFELPNDVLGILWGIGSRPFRLWRRWRDRKKCPFVRYKCS